MRGKWEGVTWAPVRRGRCTKHGTRVAERSVCIDCHKEQMQFAVDNRPEAKTMVDDVQR